MAKELKEKEVQEELSKEGSVKLSPRGSISIGNDAMFAGSISCDCEHAEDSLESKYKKKLLETKIDILDKIQDNIKDNGNMQHINALAATFKSLS